MEYLNSVNFLILAIFAFFIMNGLRRGLLKEVLSLCAWIAASIVSTLCTAKLAATFSGSASNSAKVFGSSQSLALVTAPTNAPPIDAAPSFSSLSTGVCFVGLFIATLILSSFFLRSLSYAAEKRNISQAYHLLGGVFGGMRAILITTIIIFLAQLTPIDQQSAWKSSQLAGIFQPLVKVINDFMQK